MEIKLPEKIKVAAFDIDVVSWTHLAAAVAHRYGEFSSLELTIRIDAAAKPQKVLDTFLHEIGHAIYWAYGIEDEDKEERVVSTQATAWAQIFIDNPDVLRFINDIVSNKE